MVKNLPANVGDAGDAARSLGREDPLEKKMAPTPVFLLGEAPWTEEPGGAAVHGVADSDMTERLSMHAHLPEINLF